MCANCFAVPRQKKTPTIPHHMISMHQRMTPSLLNLWARAEKNCSFHCLLPPSIIHNHLDAPVLCLVRPLGDAILRSRENSAFSIQMRISDDQCLREADREVQESEKCWDKYEVNKAKIEGVPTLCDAEHPHIRKAQGQV